jgi:tRNA threonylcarbamoyl adenosine modification protein (Sua5/YciO/YrdC/YwlC family)
MLLRIDPEKPQPAFIEKVVEILKKGGVIAYPTDTVYGIGCDFTNKEAVERIYRIKNLSRHKPLSFICQDLKDISQYAQVSNTAYKIMKRLLPGPYTFILRGTKQVPRMLITHQRTVGIRVPQNEICLALVRELGSPIISTSASVNQDEVLSDPVEIDKKFGALLDLVIDGGILASDPSTIIDLTEDTPRVLREGKGPVDLFLAKH